MSQLNKKPNPGADELSKNSATWATLQTLSGANELNKDAKQHRDVLRGLLQQADSRPNLPFFYERLTQSDPAKAGVLRPRLLEGALYETDKEIYSETLHEIMYEIRFSTDTPRTFHQCYPYTEVDQFESGDLHYLRSGELIGEDELDSFYSDVQLQLHSRIYNIEKFTVDPSLPSWQKYIRQNRYINYIVVLEYRRRSGTLFIPRNELEAQIFSFEAQYDPDTLFELMRQYQRDFNFMRENGVFWSEFLYHMSSIMLYVSWNLLPLKPWYHHYLAVQFKKEYSVKEQNFKNWYSFVSKMRAQNFDQIKSHHYSNTEDNLEVHVPRLANLQMLDPLHHHIRKRYVKKILSERSSLKRFGTPREDYLTIRTAAERISMELRIAEMIGASEDELRAIRSGVRFQWSDSEDSGSRAAWSDESRTNYYANYHSDHYSDADGNQYDYPEQQEVDMQGLFSIDHNLSFNFYKTMSDAVSKAVNALGMSPEVCETILSACCNLYVAFKHCDDPVTVGCCITSIITTLGLTSEIIPFLRGVFAKIHVKLITRKDKGIRAHLQVGEENSEESTPAAEEEKKIMTYIRNFDILGGLTYAGGLAFMLLTGFVLKKMPGKGTFQEFMTNVKNLPGSVKSAAEIGIFGQKLTESIINFTKFKILGYTDSTFDVLGGVKEWYKDVDEMLSEQSTIKIKYDSAFQTKAQNLFARGLRINYEFRQMHISLEKQGPFQQYLMASKRLKEMAEASGAGYMKPRQEPLIVQLYGCSGAGKSTVINALLADFFKTKGVSTHKDITSQTYYRHVGQEYWAGYHPGVKACVIDDFGAIRDVAGKPTEEFKELIYMGNNAPFGLHMAELESKANTFFQAELLLLTSNKLDYPCPSLTHKSALTRRLEIRVRMHINPNYSYEAREDNETVHRLDASKVTLDRKNFLKPYLFDIVNVGVTSSKTEFLFVNMTYREFSEYMLKRLTEKQMHGEQLLETLQDYISFGDTDESTPNPQPTAPPPPKKEVKLEMFGSVEDGDPEDEPITSLTTDVIDQVCDIQLEQDNLYDSMMDSLHKTEESYARAPEGAHLESTDKNQLDIPLEIFEDHFPRAHRTNSFYAFHVKGSPAAIARKEQLFRDAEIEVSKRGICHRVYSSARSLLFGHGGFTNRIHIDINDWHDLPVEKIDLKRALEIERDPNYVIGVSKLFYADCFNLLPGEQGHVHLHCLRGAFYYAITLSTWGTMTTDEIFARVFIYLEEIQSKRTGIPLQVLPRLCERRCKSYMSKIMERYVWYTYDSVFQEAVESAGQQAEFGFMRNKPWVQSSIKFISVLFSYLVPLLEIGVLYYLVRFLYFKFFKKNSVPSVLMSMPTSLEAFQNYTVDTKTRTKGNETRLESSLKTFTHKTSKVVNPADPTIKVMLADPQALMDVNGYNLSGKLLARSIYKLERFVNGKWQHLVNIFFIQGRIALINRHVLYVLCKLDYCRIRNSFCLDGIVVDTNQIEISLPGEDSIYHQRDAALLVFPQIVPAKPNVIKHFATSDDFDHWSETKKAALIGYAPVSDVIATAHTTSKVVARDVELLGGRTLGMEPKDYIIRRAYQYDIETASGECGMPLISLSAHHNQKIVGMHCSGQDDPQFTGSATPISQEFINHLMTRIPSVVKADAVISQPEVDGVQFCHMEMAQVESVQEGIDKFVFSPKHFVGHNFEVLGKYNDPVISQGKTVIQPSPIGETIVLNKTAPARLNPFFDTEGNKIDPLVKATLKAHVTPCNINELFLQEASEDFSQMIDTETQYKRVYTFEEAISGIDGDNWVCAISRSSSPGMPWIHMKRVLPGKQDFLGHDEEFIYDHPEVIKHYTIRLEAAKRGERVAVLWVDTLKDERRSLERVAIGKTRLFSVGEMTFNILFRRYFLGFCAHMMENRVNFECCVGVNVESTDWDRIAHKISEHGPRVGGADFENFDGNLLARVLWEELYIINEWYDDGDENALIRTVLWGEIVNSIHLSGDTVYCWNQSQPSGNPMTVILNSVYNSLAIRYCWLELAQHQDPKFLELAEFHKFVSCVNYGDDFVINISGQVISWFNMNTLVGAYATIGMKMTDENKSSEMDPFKSISEVSFLKRKFDFEIETARWKCPLSLDTVLEMSQWVRGKEDHHALCADNLSTAARELSQHREFVFNTWMPRLKAAAKILLIKPKFSTYKMYNLRNCIEYYGWTAANAE